eukprot:6700381-Pyramimonas_sp.AAC.1
MGIACTGGGRGEWAPHERTLLEVRVMFLALGSPGGASWRGPRSTDGGGGSADPKRPRGPSAVRSTPLN